MGACATKPKVLKADSGESPAPAPEPAPEDAAAGGGAAAETKLENGGSHGKAAEIVDDDNVDSKSRSLGNFFNDQNEGKDSNEKEKAAADPSEKQENPPETEKQTNPPPGEKPSETNPPEPPPSDAVAGKTTIISDAVETEKMIETPSEEKTTAETKKENDPKNGEPIEDKIKVEVTNENDPPTENTETSEKPIETEKEVKVISN